MAGQIHWFAWLCSKPEANKETMLLEKKKQTKKQQTISRFKIREQPQKHMRRHQFPGKAYKEVAVRNGLFGDLPPAEEQQGVSEEWSDLLHHVTRLWQSWDLSSLYSWRSETTSLFHIQHWRPIVCQKKMSLVCYTQKTGKRERQLWEKNGLQIHFLDCFLIPIVNKNCSNKIKTHTYQSFLMRNI